MKKIRQTKAGTSLLFKFDLKMRLSIVCLLLPLLGMQAKTSYAQKIVSLNYDEISISDLLDTLENKSDYRFVYKVKDVDLDHIVNVNVENEEIPKLLKNIFDETYMDFEIINDQVFLSKNPPKTLKPEINNIVRDEQQQEKEIRGIVTDPRGLPMPGVVIMVKDASRGTQTDFDGKYNIKVEVGQELEFSYIGFKNVLRVIGDQDVIDVQMEEQMGTLDEVIVTAYGEATRESITGAVSHVGSEDIVKRAGTNIFTALRGSSPGIRFNSQSGSPTSAGDIRIRGFKTIHGSNAPLTVLDGVPFSGNISDLNPDDIEEISVLKDANSAALYGARAANGVIVIRTKGGKANTGSTFEVNAKIGTNNRAFSDYDRVGPDDYMELYWAAYRNSLMTDLGMARQDANQRANELLISDQLLFNPYNVSDNQLFNEEGKLNPNAKIHAAIAEDLDWYAPMERTGVRQEYSFSGRGSNDKGGLYYSLGYLDEEGYIKNQSFNRLTARINGKQKFNEWLESGLTLSGTHQKRDRRSTSSNKHPFLWARNIAPIYPVHEHNPETGEYNLDDDGNKIFDLGDRTRNYRAGRHLIWENEKDRLTTIRNAVEGNAWISVSFLNDFTFTFNGEMSLRNQELKDYNTAEVGAGKGDNGRLNQRRTYYKKYTLQQLLNWNKSIGNHHFDVLTGHETYEYNESYLQGYMVNEIFPDLRYLTNFTDYNNVNSYLIRSSRESYFGRLKYNFDKKYFAEFSARRDGTSRLARGNRWGTFWSLGGAWIIDKEDFFDLDWVDALKLRASYGEVGDDSGASRFSYMSLYSMSTYGHEPAFYKTQNAADNLKWETVTSGGVALEGTLFDRLNFSIEYFDKRSKDLLFDVNMPLSSGATSLASTTAVVTQNLGSISNRGFEFAVDVDIIRNQDFRWNIGVNGALEKNKIVRLPEQLRENGVISGNKKRVEGRSIYDFWYRKWVGVDQMTGNSLYIADMENYNVEGSNPDAGDIPISDLVHINDEYYTTNPSYAKRDWSGTAFPDIYGGVHTQIDWKGFSLSAMAEYQLGGKLTHGAYTDLMVLSGTASALHVDAKKAWDGVPEGMTADSPDRIDPNGVPVMDFSRSGDNNISSDRWLEDASYFAIRNVDLSYSFSKPVLNKLALKSLSVNIGIENLTYFTKFKGMVPDLSFAGSYGSDYVPLRRVNFGIRVGI